MKQNKFVMCALVTAITFSSIGETFAAFGGSRSGGIGVSRSMSRPSVPVSKPTYSAPSYNRTYNQGSGSGYRQNTYTPNTYNQGNYGSSYRPNSVGRDIGVGVASVAGGILAAEAVKSLIAGPHGTYTHPQYPGQYFNASGAPVAAPQGAQQAPTTDVYGSAQNAPYAPYAQPQAVVVQQPKDNSGIFPFWSFVGGILEFIATMGIVGALAYGGYKLYGWVKRKIKKEKESMNAPDLVAEFDDIDMKAQKMFTDFQASSNDVAFIKANSLNMDIDSCMSEPSRVISYQHKVLDVDVERGAVVSSVLYEATVINQGTDEYVKQIWNYQKDNGKWKLIGVEQSDV